MKRDCGGGDRDKDKGKSGKKITGKPKVKRSWCAYHTDGETNHYSNSCAQLRKLSYEERSKKLKDNQKNKKNRKDQNKKNPNLNKKHETFPFYGAKKATSN